MQRRLTEWSADVMSAAYCFDGATPWTRSRLRSVKRHGGVAVSVYIVGTPGGMRCALKDDVDLARSMGLGVLPNWERAADFFAHCDRAQARAAGAEALAACRALGFPDDGTISVPFSFDFQIPVSRYPEMAAKLLEADAGLGGHYRPVAYGQSEFLEYLARMGEPGPHWLMGSTFRSTSQFYVSEVSSPHVAMVQMHDAAGNWLSSPVSGTDINTITQPHKLGAWWPTDSTYVQGDAMTMDKDVAAAFAALNAKVDALPAHILGTRVEIWNKTTPTVATLLSVLHKYGNGNRAAVAALGAAVAEKVVSFDAQAAAAQLRDRFLALIGGQQ